MLLNTASTLHGVVSAVVRHCASGRLYTILPVHSPKAIIANSQKRKTVNWVSIVITSPIPIAALSKTNRVLTSLYVLSRVGVTYKTCFGLDDRIYCTLDIHTVQDYRQLQRYSYSPHFPVHRCTRITYSQSSLVVSWQRIYSSLTVTSNHTWSLLVTVSFLPCHFCSCQFRRLDSTTLD
jgi:hypothetical protein